MKVAYGATPAVATRAGGARDVHDVAAVGHQRQQRLRQEERPLQVHVEQAVELLLGHGRDRIVEAVAGIVDEDSRSRAAPGRGECRATRVAERRERSDAVSDVELQRDRLAVLRLRWRRTTSSAPSGWLL